jgi:hypothetical protein
MTKTILKRQFITDAAGNPIGVILPLEEFALVEEILEQQSQTLSEADKLDQMEQPLARTERKRQLAAAAEALLSDYTADGELTIFTALDSEDFYASG